MILWGQKIYLSRHQNPTIHLHDTEALMAALKVMALGEKDRLHGKAMSAEDSPAQLAAARQKRK